LRAELAAIHRLLTDRPYALGIIGQYLLVDDPEVLADTYDVYVVKYLERMPYPDDASIQGVLDELADEVPRAREVSPGEFYDTRSLRGLEEGGCARWLWPGARRPPAEESLRHALRRRAPPPRRAVRAPAGAARRSAASARPAHAGRRLAGDRG